MFKQVFRVTFLAFIWKQYKAIICSTVILFVYLWLVGTVHEDFLQYAQSQNDQTLAGMSFLYKWMALIGGVVLYLAYHGWRQRKRDKPKNKPVTSDATDNDPFAEIRQKKTLRSKADMMIERDGDRHT